MFINIFYKKLTIKIWKHLIIDSKRLRFFCPILISLGIITYYTTKYEISLYIIILVLTLLITGLITSRQHISKLAITAFILFFLGITVSHIRINSLHTNILPPNQEGIHTVYGTIDNIKHYYNKQQLILNNLTISDLTAEETPRKIVINQYQNRSYWLRNGNIIRFKAKLFNITPSYKEKFWDYSNYLITQGIGARGYTKSRVIKLDNTTGIKNTIKNWSLDTERWFIKTLGKPYGNIASAILIGEKYNIPSTIQEEIRISGIAHLLAISGMHLNIISFMLFYSFRYLITLLFPGFSTNHNNKKTAAALTIIGNIIYLLIAGWPISAQRAVIMNLFLLTGILINRNISSIHSLNYAAIIILITQPESLFSPSFQLSFSATLFIIASIPHIYSSLYISPILAKSTNKTATKLKKIIIYFLSTASISFVAIIATSIFTIYHFQQVNSYGIISNIMIVPIFCFITLPIGFILLILSVFPIELLIIPLKAIFNLSVNYILYITKNIAYLPYSAHKINLFNDPSLLLITLAILWFFIWRQKIRYTAVIFLLTLTLVDYEKPEIILHSNKIAAIYLANEKNLFPIPYKKNKSILRKIRLETSAKKNKPKNLECHNGKCLYTNSHNKKILFLIEKIETQDNLCDENIDIIINYQPININCDNIKTISIKEDMEQNILIYPNLKTYRTFLNTQ